MKKRLTAVLCALAIACCTACGSSSDSNSASDGSAAQTTAAELEALDMKTLQDSIVEIPDLGYDGNDRTLTYPKFQKYTYFSNTAGRDTNVNVLLPADYSEDKQYPVLYILHGYYDSEEWMARPVVAIDKILTNLQKKGEAKEMIVVLPYIFCSKELPRCTGMDDKNSLAYDNFINDLTTDLMPFIEKTFSVAKGRENTAITGFSMGGRESLFIGIKHPELFGYVGAVCPAPGLVEIPGSAMHPGQIKEAEMTFPAGQEPRILLISSSNADNVVSTSPDSYRKAFEKNGVTFLTHRLQRTGHDHTSVKPHLYNFFKLIFK